MDKQKITQAGKIAKEVKEFAKELVKPEMLLLEIAEKIENKIIKLGGKPAFPTNLSINEIAAHYTPTYNDTTKAIGLLKIDFGVHIDGWVADTAFSIDLENSDENKKLIQAAEAALENATKEFQENKTTSQIGEVIQKTIEEKNLQPIINLSGHSMEQYDLHAGITIPNIDDEKNIQIKKGLYAIEPFTTTGTGKVQDGNPSGIYQLQNENKPRSPKARKILEFIKSEYNALPFCSRWIVKKFGAQALFALRELEQNSNLHQYPQLIESSHSKVAQAEDTILVDDEMIITTR